MFNPFDNSPCQPDKPGPPDPLDPAWLLHRAIDPADIKLWCLLGLAPGDAVDDARI